MIKVKKATRVNKKLRLAVSGQPGAGKTYAALKLATAIVGAKAKILVFDTEAGRASLYADMYDFDVWEFDPQEQGRSVSYKDYIDIIAYAEDNNYDVVILDSITPEWDDIQNIHAAMKGNSYQNWGKVKAGEHQRFLEAILYSKVHVISTIRSKEKTELVEGKVVSAGVGEQQESNLKYFLDFIFSIQDRKTHEGTLEKGPPGFSEPYEGLTFKITDKFCKDIIRWLETGVPEEIYNILIRLKQLNSQFEELTGSRWPKFLSDEEFSKLSKEEIVALGKELAEEVRNLKEKENN